MLESRCEVIGITGRNVLVVIDNTDGSKAISPKVEVFRHVYLFEYIHKALLFCGFFYFVSRADRDDVSIFAVVEVMSSQKCHD